MIELKENDISAMYVDLDCILDTRMSTLFKMGEDVVTKAIDLGWHERLSDFLPGIDFQVYQDLYKNRDKSTLKEAVMTPVAEMIREFALRTMENVLNSPFHYHPKIIVNVWPYQLDDDEKNVIASTVRHLTVDLAVVDIINFPPEKITPTYVKYMLSIMVKYEYMEWLEMHSASKEFEKVTCPDVSLLGPRLYLKKPTRVLQDNEDPFKETMEEAAPLIGLVLLPIENFSMVLKPVKKT